MATTCPTTEAALQTGLLPTQERRKGRFAKASAFFYGGGRPDFLILHLLLVLVGRLRMPTSASCVRLRPAA